MVDLGVIETVRNYTPSRWYCDDKTVFSSVFSLNMHPNWNKLRKARSVSGNVLSR